MFDAISFAPFQPLLWAVLPSAASTQIEQYNNSVASNKVKRGMQPGAQNVQFVWVNSVLNPITELCWVWLLIVFTPIFDWLISCPLKTLHLHDMRTTETQWWPWSKTQWFCSMQMDLLCSCGYERRVSFKARDGKLATKRERVTYKLLTENVMEKIIAPVSWEKIINGECLSCIVSVQLISCPSLWRYNTRGECYTLTRFTISGNV